MIDVKKTRSRAEKLAMEIAIKEHQKYVKPGSPGLMVRFPGGSKDTVLPEEGGYVPWVGSDGRYWRRRLASGDVVISAPKRPKVEKKTRY